MCFTPFSAASPLVAEPVRRPPGRTVPFDRSKGKIRSTDYLDRYTNYTPYLYTVPAMMAICGDYILC